MRQPFPASEPSANQTYAPPVRDIPVLVLNLPGRVDRKQRFREHFAEQFQTACQPTALFRTPEFIDGVAMADPTSGCCLGHLSCMIRAEQTKQPWVLICEDDLVFSVAAEDLIKAAAQQATPWPALVLGGCSGVIPDPCGLWIDPINQHMIQLRRGGAQQQQQYHVSGGFCMFIHSSIIPWMQQCLRWVAVQRNLHWDNEILGRLPRVGVMLPFVAGVHTGRSDVRGGPDFRNDQRDFVEPTEQKFLAAVSRLLES